MKNRASFYAYSVHVKKLLLPSYIRLKVILAHPLRFHQNL